MAAGFGRQVLARWRSSTLRVVGVGGLALAVSAVANTTALASTGSAGTVPTCTPSLLVLSAMPLELDPLLASAHVSSAPATVLHDRPFVTGTLQGNQVIMGLTGIGPANALAAITDAFDHFQCDGQSEITGVVFSGTSGGDFIGDVFVPTSWSDDGATPVATDATMYAAAQQAMVQDPPALEQSTPVGDPFCTCDDVPAVDNLSTGIAVQHVPTVEFGGTGLTTDPFNGMALPCAPAGSDVFGCVPCREIGTAPLQQTEDFATGIVPFLEPTWLAAYLQASTPPGTWVSSDNETAVVAAVAQAHGVPFIGFRAASDGGGDPLHLPGFPAEFFVYRQLAADNAAAAALSFLHLWGATH